MALARFDEIVCGEGETSYQVDQNGIRSPVSRAALKAARVVLQEWADSDFVCIPFSRGGEAILVNTLMVDIESLKNDVRSYQNQTAQLRARILGLEMTARQHQETVQDLEMKLDQQRFEKIRINKVSESGVFGCSANN